MRSGGSLCVARLLMRSPQRVSSVAGTMITTHFTVRVHAAFNLRGSLPHALARIDAMLYCTVV